MPQSVMQHAFHAGEFAPALNARVDLAKYHSAAALLRNFFVDYRGGVSTRTGTKYILQCYKSATAVRLITFQASFTVGYVLEFGDMYIRFFNNGSPILETATVISGATQANPGVITNVAHGYTTGDWVQIKSVVGMAQLNTNYYIVVVIDADHYSLTDLNGVAINTTAYSAYVSGGTAQRVYTLPSPYAASELRTIKFAQNVNALILCHPNHQPYVLTLIAAANWTLLPIIFGSTISAPTNVVASTTLAAGTVNYSYLVTAVDANGQESGPSATAILANKADLRTVAGTNRITWTAVSGATSYNVYKAELSYSGAIPAGASFGFIGNCTGVALDDSNIAPDFSLTPPIPQNPFQGAGLQSVTVTNAGAYTTVPTATVDAAPTGGQTATVQPVLQVTVAVLSGGSSAGFAVGDIILPWNGTDFTTNYGGVQLRVASIDGSGHALTFTIVGGGAIISGNTPANPQQFRDPTGARAVNVTLTWGVGIVSVISAGAGYTSVPNVTFSAGAATATAVLATASGGNPAVPIFFQQRLVLAALSQAPNAFFMSQPGAYFNFNISNPVQASDAISGALVSAQLETIKSMVAMSSGLIVLTDHANWQLNGGSAGSAVEPSQIVANPQSRVGASDVPPIVGNFDILYPQAKGSVIRDSTYNFYANIFTGTDISVLSSHLFYGYTIPEWCWAEEPFKVVWAVRSDGALLALTFMKEQELIGWTKSDTTGLFKSVTVVTEAVTVGSVDAVYTVVERTINGNTVKYIERFAERQFVAGDPTFAWFVDAGIQYNGAPVTNFSGAQHLAGATCTGLADGLPITPFVMGLDGSFILPTAASVVTVGLAFLPQLKTLSIDVPGKETVQGKRKKIPAVTVRVENTLGLFIGTTLDTLVPMDDLIEGNVGTNTNEIVTGLVTGDALQNLDPDWNEPGQYYITQPFPYPATILGVIPELAIGDTEK